MDFNTLRDKYPNFIYHKYDIEKNDKNFKITYYFEIEGLSKFNPTLTIPVSIIVNSIDNNFFKNLVFNLGMVELLSYVKCTCSPNIIVKAGYLNERQVKFFKKLYYLGLGEFRYLNNINIEEENFFNIQIDHNKQQLENIKYNGAGNLINVGGGKDSCVTMELLKDMDNTCLVINPKKAQIECINVSGYDSIFVNRTIDKNLIKLNEEGFLNGHTPFSAMVAFASYIVAYLSNKEYIVLSNEGSANESTVLGTQINHQYSKTYEFELDFYNYTKENFKIGIKYFSFLRPLSEFQIGMIFANIKKYHNVFKSCNVGSKNENWNWCANCSKCLFVYTILSPFLTEEELIEIFHENMYENESLLETFKELLGYSKTKPFDCVGTYEEVRYAASLAIKKYNKLPYLLKYYKDNYPLEFKNIKKDYNKDNNLDEEFNNIIRKELEKYD